jgi:arsenate reductase-like glutaredoxin family protein
VKEQIPGQPQAGRRRSPGAGRRKASKVIVMKGKKVTTFDMKKDKPADEDLLKVMLGATGNLRAPTIVRGKTLLVGFNAEEYDRVFG